MLLLEKGIAMGRGRSGWRRNAKLSSTSAKTLRGSERAA
jgi:hypothetical protein